MSKKVLITGATGFIGRHCIEPLLNRGFEIHAPYIGAKGEDRPGLHWHECNLMDGGEIQALLETYKPTHLLHFAWYAIPGKYWTATENLHWVSASLNLIEKFAARGGKRIVCAGTCAEYSWDYGFCHERETPLVPNTLYGVSKASLYKMLESYTQLNDLSFAWGRIFFLYGKNEPESRLVPSIITHLLQDKDVKCSHGEQIRDFLHVEDIADAFSTLLDSELNGPINIASGHPVTLKEVIQLISSKITSQGRPLFGALPNNPNDPPKIIADVSRLNNELGWMPRKSLDTGIVEAIDWWSSKLALV